MLQSEFTTRTKVHVSAEEYAHIEAVYMASDVDKDEFCRLWVLMNKQRVKAYKERVKQQEAQQAQRDKLWKLIEKYGWKDYSWKETHFAETTLTATEQKLVEGVGIEVRETRIEPIFGHTVLDPKLMSTLLWEVREYLKAA